MSDPTTVAGRALLDRANREHVRLLATISEVREMDRQEWLDIFGDAFVSMIREALPDIEAEARAAAESPLREALEGVVAAWDSVLPAINGMTVFMASRGMPYTGPVVEPIFDAARDALAATATREEAEGE